MIARPEVHPLAKQHIRELEEHWKCKLELEDKMWIVKLAERCLNPTGEGDLDAMGMPVKVGFSDVYLYPLTIGASVWLRECGAAWYGGKIKQSNRAECFVMAHARDSDTIRKLWNRTEADRLIRNWERYLPCTYAELVEARDTIYPPQHPEKRTKKEDEAAEKTRLTLLAEELEVMTGMPIDHWLWEVSFAAALRRWTLAKRHAASMAAMGEADRGERLSYEQMLAFKNLATAKKWLIDNRGGEVPDNVA